ncbi:MAG TPA: 4Fe-4S dicluster domain-containing protein [Symbiobacteriaceae bacterium]|nr:4Fe-4S dicluster domain-containing protein [Symbiobacteriaceae bacterium]
MKTQLNAFVVADPGKCIGCRVCEVACAVVHSDLPVTTVGTMVTPIIPKMYMIRTATVTMPVHCRHCEDAPCGNACPVGAITQKGDVIFINEELCVGCKTCMMACPFGAVDLMPQYREGKQVLQRALKTETLDGLVETSNKVANKCDRCFTRPAGPACVEACPKQALELINPSEARRKRNLDAAIDLFESVRKFIG